MKNISFWGICLAGVMFFSSVNPVMADEQTATAGKGKIITLSQEQATACIKALPEFMKEFPAFNTLGQAQAEGKPDISNIAALSDLAKLNDFSASNGFKDFADFGQQFSALMSGYMYFKTLELKKMFEEQLKTLPPETAALLSVQIKPINDNLEKLKKNVSPELLKAVEPHVAELDKILGVAE